MTSTFAEKTNITVLLLLPLQSNTKVDNGDKMNMIKVVGLNLKCEKRCIAIYMKKDNIIILIVIPLKYCCISKNNQVVKIATASTSTDILH